MLVLIDQDGPLADFEKGFLDRWQAQYPDEFSVPLDQRKTLHLREEYPPRLREKVESIYRAPGFYLRLPPTPGCIDAINTFLELGHDLRICTAPLSHYDNCVLEKYQWVEKHFGRELTKKIILTRDKTVIRGDVLIDDNPSITGVFAPEWEHVLFDAPYNQSITGKRRLRWHNWQEVLGV